MRLEERSSNDERQGHLIRDLIPFVIYIFINGSSGYAFFAFSPRVLNEHMSEGFVSLVLLFQPGVVIAFSSFFGRISDRIRNRKRLVTIALLIKSMNYMYFNFLIIFNVGSVFSYIVVYSIRGFSIALSTCEGAWFSDFTFNRKENISRNEKGSRHTGISYYFFLTSISWALGAVIIGWLIQSFSITHLALFLFFIAIMGFVPLFFIKDNFATIKISKKVVIFNLKSDLKELEEGRLVYPAIMLRHFGLITSLSLLAIVLEDIGVKSGIAGTIISLNPLMQIFGMGIGTAVVTRTRMNPLKLFSFGLLLSSIVVTMYSLGAGFQSGTFLAMGQILLGFAWSFLIIGFEEYIIRNVNWNKRANYISYRQTFMNIGKVSGQLFYFLSYEMMHLTRVLIFSILIFFPLTGFILSLIALSNLKHSSK
ncbi:MAG: MFS transporter [Promethearchaeota archaeon]